MSKHWLDDDFAKMVLTHKVDVEGKPSKTPWTFEHCPVMGAIDNQQIQAADGTFVGSVYTYADAKLICDLVNRK